MVNLTTFAKHKLVCFMCKMIQLVRNVHIFAKFVSCKCHFSCTLFAKLAFCTNTILSFQNLHTLLNLRAVCQAVIKNPWLHNIFNQVARTMPHDQKNRLLVEWNFIESPILQMKLEYTLYKIWRAHKFLGMGCRGLSWVRLGQVRLAYVR